jgi:hypothetical protein
MKRIICSPGWITTVAALLFALGLKGTVQADLGRGYVNQEVMTVSEEAPKAGIKQNLREENDGRIGNPIFPEQTSEKKCLQKPGQGPCKGLFERYYFDPQTQTCKRFFWGGCQGVVPFETEEDCRKTCGSKEQGQ